jgi:DnaJ-class molecular chaperone
MEAFRLVYIRLYNDFIWKFIMRSVPCKVCDGKGVIKARKEGSSSSYWETVQCKDCKGKGWIELDI